MNHFDALGIMMTYSQKAKHARDEEDLKNIIAKLKENWICVRLLWINKIRDCIFSYEFIMWLKSM